MDTSISEDMMASLKRTNEIRMAKICRLCLQQTSLQNINIDPKFKQVLTEGTAKFLPNDPNFPQFVCESCRKMVKLLHKFNQRRAHSARLIRSYMAHGGSYPEAKLLEEKQQERSNKRPAPSQKNEQKIKDSKKSKAKDENHNDFKSKERLSKASKSSEKEHSKSKQKVQHKSEENKCDVKDKSVSSKTSSK